MKLFTILAIIIISISPDINAGEGGTGGGGGIPNLKMLKSGFGGSGESPQITSIINSADKYIKVETNMISNIQLTNGQIINSLEEINDLNDTTKNDKFIHIKKNSNEIFDILLTSGKVCTIKENYCY